MSASFIEACARRAADALADGEDGTSCSVCMARPRTVRNLPCEHAMCCELCTLQIIADPFHKSFTGTAGDGNGVKIRVGRPFPASDVTMQWLQLDNMLNKCTVKSFNPDTATLVFSESTNISGGRGYTIDMDCDYHLTLLSSSIEGETLSTATCDIVPNVDGWPFTMTVEVQ